MRACGKSRLQPSTSACPCRAPIGEAGEQPSTGFGRVVEGFEGAILMLVIEVVEHVSTKDDVEEVAGTDRVALSGSIVETCTSAGFAARSETHSSSVCAK